MEKDHIAKHLHKRYFSHVWNQEAIYSFLFPRAQVSEKEMLLKMYYLAPASERAPTLDSVWGWVADAVTAPALATVTVTPLRHFKRFQFFQNKNRAESSVAESRDTQTMVLPFFLEGGGGHLNWILWESEQTLKDFCDVTVTTTHRWRRHTSVGFTHRKSLACKRLPDTNESASGDCSLFKVLWFKVCVVMFKSIRGPLNATWAAANNNKKQNKKKTSPPGASRRRSYVSSYENRLTPTQAIVVTPVYGPVQQ